jgi:hypothetical protein
MLESSSLKLKEASNFLDLRLMDNHTCIFCSLYSEPWNVSFGFPLKVYRISKPDSKFNTR